MAGLHDLALLSGAINAPALGRNPDQLVAGATWIWSFANWADSNGDPIDFSTCTAECRITDLANGMVLAEPTFTGYNDGTAVLQVDETATALISPGPNGVRAQWGLLITDGVDTVAFWVPADSPLTIVASN
jgi:hypothetical protein